MATAIRYADILNYLTAIMNKETNPISGSPHGEWWSGLSYNDFVNGQVPNLGVPIMNSTIHQSAFYVILTNTNGYQGMPQMPCRGPFITDARLQRDPTRQNDDLRGDDPGEHPVVARERIPRQQPSPAGQPDPKEDTARRTQHETPSACRRAGAPDPSRADRRTGPAADLQQC